MTMPIDLLFLRHGESEGNLVKRRVKDGDLSGFTQVFRDRHSSKYRLTDKGIAQAKAAGAWLKKNGSATFGRLYVSEYLRAMETAGHLALKLEPDQRWYCDFFLRERDYGVFDSMTDQERLQKFEEYVRHRDRDGKYWLPPGGESIADVSLRLGRVLDTLHRECSKMRVLIVSHGEVMWAARIRLERMSDDRFQELDASTHDHDRIRNCQILHYTRRDPDTGQETRRYDWMRSICPWDESLSSNEWRPIVRPTYTNEQLLERVARQPRLVNEE